MPLFKPDELQPNNQSLALVDSNFIRGGGRVVADLTALYALSTKPDQLKEFVTRVYVQADSYVYLLINIGNAANSNGWKQIVQTTQANLDGKLNVGANTSLSGSGPRIVQATDTGIPQALYIPRNGFVTDADVINAIISADYSSQSAQYIAPANNKIFQAGQQYWEGGLLYTAWKDNFSTRSNFIQKVIIGTIDDTAGVRTIAQLNTAFPTAVVGQHVVSSSRVYEKNTTGWFYLGKTDCS